MTLSCVRRRVCAAFVICTATAVAAPAQTFTSLLSFDGPNGAEPYLVSPVQGADGAFYGTTEIGGNRSVCQQTGCGTIFRINLQGGLTRLGLTKANSMPLAGVVLATDGNFYGTTQYGGDGGPCDSDEFPGCGTIYKITPTGKLTTLYSFCVPTGCPDGAYPFAPLIQAADGDFYGTTWSGGSGGGGTVFKITASGRLTTLYSFCPGNDCTHGSEPYAGLLQATDGDFYGTTSAGGDNNCGIARGCGTAFRITPAGALMTLHTFEASDGSDPTAGLALGKDGNFYGTTFLGGDLTCDPPYGCGTVFKITPNGAITTLYSLEDTDGVGPTATLVLATDGNFYGTTTGVKNGTVFNDGTIFKISPMGALATLYSFNDTDGRAPSGGLLQATNGNFYGTTAYGGDLTCDGHDGCGTVYNLNVGLGPFVAFVHLAGKIGQSGGILGQGFTGTNAVSFNGTPASFEIVSDTYLTATVPAGATTGYVTVTTPSGTLTSNVPFHVIP